jgi:hypothetical protein
MSTNQLHHTWLQRIRQLRPDERVTRLRNFAWLLTGIYQSHSVHLSKIAGKIPGPAKWFTRQVYCKDRHLGVE